MPSNKFDAMHDFSCKVFFYETSLAKVLWYLGWLLTSGVLARLNKRSGWARANVRRNLSKDQTCIIRTVFFFFCFMFEVGIPKWWWFELRMKSYGLSLPFPYGHTSPHPGFSSYFVRISPKLSVQLQPPTGCQTATATGGRRGLSIVAPQLQCSIIRTSTPNPHSLPHHRFQKQSFPRRFHD